MTIFCALKYVPKYAKYGIWDAVLGALDMVKWGIPEKILQNVVQTRFQKLIFVKRSNVYIDVFLYVQNTREHMALPYALVPAQSSF